MSEKRCGKCRKRVRILNDAFCICDTDKCPLQGFPQRYFQSDQEKQAQAHASKIKRLMAEVAADVLAWIAVIRRGDPQSEARARVLEKGVEYEKAVDAYEEALRDSGAAKQVVSE